MTTDDLAAPFESAGALRAAHMALLDALERAISDASDAGNAPDEHDAVRVLHEPIRQFLTRGVAAGTLIEEPRERSDCQVLLDYWISMLARAGLDVPAPRLVAFDPAQLPTLEGQPCPYVGLESFRDKTYFFGREHDTDQLVAQIHGQRLVVVLGASGSGKSSLVLAGALPRLRTETTQAGTPPTTQAAWQVAKDFVPGDAVLARLVLAAQAGPPGLAEQAVGDPGDTSLATGVEQLRTDPTQLAAWLDQAARPVVLTIDQFEEVFTLAPPADRDLLAQALAAALASPTGHRVVLTMREEFRTAITEMRALEPWLSAAWFQVSPMGYDGLRAAVEKPAALAGLRFQPGVVDDLVKRMLGQPAALPLLQFTLQGLWETRDRNRITREVYERLGDPLEALKKSADVFFEALLPETQAEVQRVLVALVRINELLEAYRQPVRRRKLLEPGRASTAAVLDLLQARGYVRISRGVGEADDVVEIRHEALIRNWPRLVDWIDDERRARRQRLALLQAAQRWHASGRPAEGLLTGWQLQEAERQTALSELERAFVLASAQALDKAHNERLRQVQAEADAARALARKKTRLGQGAMVLLAVALVVILGLWRVAWTQQQDQKGMAVINDELVQSRERQVVRLAELQAENDRLAKLQAANDQQFARQVQRAVEPTLGGGDRGTSSSGSGRGDTSGGGSGTVAEAPVTVFLHISDESQRARANQIAAQLQRSGIVVPGVEKVVAVSRSQVRYFRTADRSGAEQIAQLLARVLGVDDVTPTLVAGYAQKAGPRRYELWFSPNAFGPVATVAKLPAPVAGPLSLPTLGAAQNTPAAAGPPSVQPNGAPPPPSQRSQPAALVEGGSALDPGVPARTAAPPPLVASAAPQPTAAASTQTTAVTAPSPWSEAQRVEMLIYRLEHDKPATRASDLNRSLILAREWASARALNMNIRTALGRAVLYDTAVSLGVVRASFVRARKHPSNGSRPDEEAWLLDFLNRREQPSANVLSETAHEKRRVSTLRRLIADGQWDLAEERPSPP